MFVELMPLLAGRTVLITVAKLDDKTLRVNVSRKSDTDCPTFAWDVTRAEPQLEQRGIALTSECPYAKVTIAKPLQL